MGTCTGGTRRSKPASSADEERVNVLGVAEEDDLGENSLNGEIVKNKKEVAGTRNCWSDRSACASLVRCRWDVVSTIYDIFFLSPSIYFSPRRDRVVLWF